METDQALLNAARMMDRNAIVRIFDLYSHALYGYALRLCGDPMLADQIVGDVFAKLLEQLSVGNGPTVHLRSYLYEMTYHRIIDEARYARRRVPLEVTDWLPPGTDPMFLQLEDKILFERIAQAIRDELTHDQRHVIILRFLEEFSLRETAGILGKEVGHVKVIQGRALAKLRGSLEEYRGMLAVPSPRIRTVPKTLGI
jgi:RNA polymerase sigma-70 factor, ECF subfamily